MANFYGTGRSNYVKVTNEDKFIELCKKYGLTFIESEGKVGFYSNQEDGDFLTEFDEDGNLVEDDALTEFSKLLKDNEVLVYMVVGNEKHRYLTGYSVAINNKGVKKSVDITDIYKKAEKLGKNITIAEY